MLEILNKLKLYIKLGPEAVHKAPMCVHIKIYLWSFVDYHHLQKYFYNWNITLNYCFICKINIRVTLSGNAPGSLIASNAHISTPLFRPLWKIVNDSKNYVPAVSAIMSFKVLKYFSNGKRSLFLFPGLW